MSEAARRDFSPLVIGTSAEPGPIAATFPGIPAKRPNLVALAAIAFISELLAVAGALWVSLAVCGALVPQFQAPQPWFGILVSALMVASIAERGDYGAGVILDCGLRPWSLAKASLQTAGAVLLLACPSIIVTATFLGRSATPFEIGGMGPATLIVWVFAFVTIAYVAVLSVRLVGRVATAPLARPRRVVVVGEAGRCGRLISSLRQAPRRSMRILGIVDHEASSGDEQTALARRWGLPALGQLDDLLDMVRRGKVDVIIVALPWSEGTKIREIIESAESTPVDVLLTPDLGAAFEPLATSTIEPASVPLLRAIYPPLLGWKAFVKRTEDIVLAAALTLLAAPAMLTVAALVKLTSRGPVFSRQHRFGYEGRVFQQFKFRTEYAPSGVRHGAEQTGQNDPRVTPFGAWLRRKSLDELPQLINVLLGHMSLVGPRLHSDVMTASEPPDQAAAAYLLRQRVRPGLTGWSQVSDRRSSLPTDNASMDRVSLDLEYIRDWSLAFDLKVMWLTIGLLINDRNVY